MKKMAIVFLLAGLFSAVFASDPSEIHPGLKNAIDAGNIELAENIINKVGVNHLYLPATLSIPDAERLYANRLDDDMLAMYFCRKDRWNSGISFCDAAFTKKYVEYSCNGKRPIDVKVCAAWMEKSAPQEWLAYEEGICQSQETIENCKKLIDSIDNEKRMEYFKRLESKNLLQYDTMVSYDTTVMEPIPVKECLARMDEYAANQRAVINSKRNGTFEFLFGFCSFDGTNASKKTCMAKLDKAVKEVKKDCKKGTEKRSVKKTVSRKKKILPFESSMNNQRYYLDEYPWFKIDGKWLADVRFLEKYIGLREMYGMKGESLAVYILKDKYARKGDLDINMLVRYCKEYPTIDKSAAKEFGFELFSCEKILNDYNYVCDDNVDSTRIFNSALNGGETQNLYCDFNRWRSLTVIEDSLGLCTRKLIGSIAKNGMVCDTSWKYPARVDLEDEPCENAKVVKSRFGDISYKCENGTWLIDGEDKFVDMRDGQTYRFVSIGSQTWMAENLNLDVENSWCYDNNNENCVKYGHLYTWKEAKAACPEDWHLPSRNEFIVLLDEIGENAAEKLKSAEGWDGHGGKDSYGFSALPAGYYARGYSQWFSSLGDGAYIWSLTEAYSGHAYTLDFYYNEADYNNEANVRDYHSETEGLSVRCLKDSN